MRKRHLSFRSDRCFGVELEILAADGRNRPEGGEDFKPEGADYVTALVKKNADEGVEWRCYEHTDENNCWVIKPDSSCGLEICSPIYRNWRGINKVCKVVDAFRKDPNIIVDQRCSVHVHVEVADLSLVQVASVIAHWVKCDAVFLDMVPNHRKMNRYCQFLAMHDIFDTDIYMSPEDIILAVGDVKYYTMNTHQWQRSDGKRKTLEFRIIEGEGCKDPFLIKNWLRLLLHFVEMTARRPVPPPYVKGNPWSWVCLLDPEDVFKLLGFAVNQYELSNGLTQTRNWMLARLLRYMTPDVKGGPRWKAYEELNKMVNNLQKAENKLFRFEEHLSPSDLQEALYADNLRF